MSNIESLANKALAAIAESPDNSSTYHRRTTLSAFIQAVTNEMSAEQREEWADYGKYATPEQDINEGVRLTPGA